MASRDETMSRVVLAVMASLFINGTDTLTERNFHPATAPAAPFGCAQTWQPARHTDPLPYVLPRCLHGIDPTLAKRVFEATVEINVVDTSGRQFMGMGVVIGADGSVLTASHVVDAAKDIRVYSRELSADGLSQGWHPSRTMFINAFDSKLDAAVISPNDLVTVDWPKPLSLCAKTFRRNETLWHFGGRTAWSIADVINPDILFESAGWLTMQTAIFWGDSGGPIVDDRSRVVGVIIAIDNSRSQADMAYGVPVRLMNTLLTHVPIRRECQ